MVLEDAKMEVRTINTHKIKERGIIVYGYAAEILDIHQNLQVERIARKKKNYITTQKFKGNKKKYLKQSIYCSSIYLKIK